MSSVKNITHIMVKVRDVTFKLDIKNGAQNFCWLASCAKVRYSHLHDSSHPEQYVPIKVDIEATKAMLLPEEIINDRLREGELCEVHLIGPAFGPDSKGWNDRVKGIWERYCYTPKVEWKNVTLTYDTLEDRFGRTEQTGIRGNFNSWQAPIRMSNIKDSTIAHITIKVPPGVTLLFQFTRTNLHDKHVASNRYPIFQDSDFNVHNELFIGEDYIDEDTEAKQQQQHTIKPATVKGVPDLTPEEKLALFNKDISAMNFTDITPEPESKQRLVDTMFERYDYLRFIFRFYCAQGSSTGNANNMSLLKWTKFCRACLLYDEHKCTTQAIDAIFTFVNAESRNQEEKMLLYKDAKKKPVFDTLNPIGMFVRHEFCEALMRVALLKYPKMNSPADALDYLMEHHVSNKALMSHNRDIRSNIEEPKVQELLNLYKANIEKAFDTFATPLDLDSRMESYLKLASFLKLIDSYGIYHFSSQKLGIIFSMSQKEEIAPNLEYLQLLMNIIEFKEALCRIAEEKWPLKNLVVSVQKLLESMFHKKKDQYGL